MLASWEFYNAANEHYKYYLHGKGLGISDEFFKFYCMGGEL